MEVEAILWMNDIVELTGKHRCTIHRWMHEGTFPKKDAPKDRPRGNKLIAPLLAMARQRPSCNCASREPIIVRTP